MSFAEVATGTARRRALRYAVVGRNDSADREKSGRGRYHLPLRTVKRTAELQVRSSARCDFSSWWRDARGFNFGVISELVLGWSLTQTTNAQTDRASEQRRRPRASWSRKSQSKTAACYAIRRHSDRSASPFEYLANIQCGELLTQMIELRQVIYNDIRIIGMAFQEILMVILGWIKSM